MNSGSSEAFYKAAVVAIAASTACVMLLVGFTPLILYTARGAKQEVAVKAKYFREASDSLWSNMMTLHAKVGRHGRSDYASLYVHSGAYIQKDASVYEGCSKCIKLRCPRGAAGPPGPSGEDGRPGPPGASGKPGGDGEDMLMDPLEELPCVICPGGPPGPRGAQGERGRPGPKGDSGSPGRPGNSGVVGPPGDIGGAGIPGPKGIPGQAGPIGNNAVGGIGIKGPKGPPGPAGRKGPPGIPGKPSNKNGPPGEPGIRGPPGPPGKIGLVGNPGPWGPAGDSGFPASYCPSDCGVRRIVEPSFSEETDSQFVDPATVDETSDGCC